ncbi:hypothetical protein D9M71_576260 [compost metagenome]
MYAVRLGHTCPARYGNTVPGAQPALQAGGLSFGHAHLLIVLSLDLASGQGHYPGFLRLAVETESSQLGIIGMGRDDHDALLAQIVACNNPQLPFAR